MKSSEHLHFLGIAGYAMFGVAQAAQKLGYKVTGTDDQGAYPPVSDWLTEAGIQWWREADAKHLDGVDTLIISGGSATDHIEIVAARERKIPVMSFAEFVGQVLKDDERVVVSGTHGKSTTTSLLTWILETAGKHPDFLIGVNPKNFDGTVRMERSGVAVLEGDEYVSSKLDPRSKFFHYRPDRLIINNIELDHPDVFKDEDAMVAAFGELVEQMPKSGHIYYAAGSPTVAQALKSADCASSSFGLDESDWRAANLQMTPAGVVFDLIHGDETVEGLEVGLYGRHNALNTLAASAAALDLRVNVAELREALRTFKGVSRRFERVSASDAPVTVVDDYAHHPTAAQVTIAAVKDHWPKQRLIVVYQPHTFSRTAALMDEFKHAFARADLTYLAPIQAAREIVADVYSNLTSADIAQGAQGDVRYEPDRQNLIKLVKAAAQTGDIVLVMAVDGFSGLAQDLDRAING